MKILNLFKPITALLHMKILILALTSNHHQHFYFHFQWQDKFDIMDTYPETQVSKIGKIAMKNIGIRDEEFYEVISIFPNTMKLL